MELNLVEELKCNDIIYVLLESNQYFVYGEYIVESNNYCGLKKNLAVLQLVNKPKKSRYFKQKITLSGFHICFKYTPKQYKIFSEFDEMIKYFCNSLRKDNNKNLKLLNKFKQKYPSYFHNFLLY